MKALGIRQRFARLRRDDRGLAALEFALFAPLLLSLLIGGFDLGRYLLIHGGAEKVAFSVADVSSQYEELNSSALKTIFLTSGLSLKNYASGGTGVTVLTSIYLDNKTPKVRWQCYSTNGSKWKSKIGTVGNTAAVSADLLADANDNVIISEVYYTFTPLFATFFKKDFDIYAQSLFRPRLGKLTTSPC